MDCNSRDESRCTRQGPRTTVPNPRTLPVDFGGIMCPQVGHVDLSTSWRRCLPSGGAVYFLAVLSTSWGHWAVPSASFSQGCSHWTECTGALLLGQDLKGSGNILRPSSSVLTYFSLNFYIIVYLQHRYLSVFLYTCHTASLIFTRYNHAIVNKTKKST